MNIAESMKSLTEQIIVSHDMRVKALGDLVIDTKKTLQDFTAVRQNMSSRQAKDLADFVNSLSKSVDNMLKDFHRDHRNMSDEQAKNLANFAVDLTKHVGNMMKGIQKAHKEMADNLNKSLGKGESDRLKDFKAMMGDIQKDIKDIETYVENKLKEFSDAHADMSAELKKDLAKYVSGIVSDTKKLLSEYSSDMMKTSNIWNGMSKTMAKARKGGAVAPKVAKVAAEVKVMPDKEAIKEAAKEVEEKEASPEMDLEEKILGFIKSHPEGVKVGDMETALGATRMRLGIIAKKLLDEGKVREEENQYFQL